MEPLFAVLVLSAVSVVSCGSRGSMDAASGHSQLIARNRNLHDVPLIIFPGQSMATYPEEPVPVEEEDYVELPEWMDAGLDGLSVDKISLLNNANNLQDLATLFELTKEQQDKLDKEAQQKLVEKQSGTGLRVGVRVNATEAKFAYCTPELELVELEAPPDTTYLPQCTRLQRCSGCCTSKLTSCQPTRTEVVKLKVMELPKVTKTPGVRRRRRSAVKYALVDQFNHVSCSCLCRIQEHHCDRMKQDYSPAECACVCKNREEELQCVNKSTHTWDRTTCSCMCKKILECSTGEEFSQDTCRCVRST